MLYGLFCSVSSLSPHPFFFLPTFIHLLSLVSVSPVLLLHNPCEKGFLTFCQKGEICQEWQLRKAGSKWDKNRAIVCLLDVGVLMQPYRLESSCDRDCNWACIFGDHFRKGIPCSYQSQQELRSWMNKELLPLGLSSQSSAESQEDAAYVDEMQNQHLVHMFLESGTMKLIF